MTRRTIALLVAVALAAVAAIALISYIQGERDKAFEGTEEVEVYVAKQQIAGGTSGEVIIASGLVEKKALPSRVVPPGAIGQLEQLRGRVAEVSILPNEVLVSARFVAPGQQRAGGALVIPPGRQAIAMDVTLVPGVAGFVQRGDRVSVIAQLSVPGRGGAIEPRTQFLIQNIEVLAVGRRQTAQRREDGEQQQGGAAGDRVILTLAVTPVEAEKIVYAKLQGQIYFTLVPPGARVARTIGQTARTIFRR